MLRTLMLVAATLALPALGAAQDVPNSHASDTAKSKVAQHRATHVRGSAIGMGNRPVTPATPAVPATKATPATPSSTGGAATPASPATPATPAVPASPSHKPSDPGSQSGSHRP
jgi:hypothetical protein